MVTMLMEMDMQASLLDAQRRIRACKGSPRAARIQVLVSPARP